MLTGLGDGGAAQRADRIRLVRSSSLPMPPSQTAQLTTRAPLTGAGDDGAPGTPNSEDSAVSGTKRGSPHDGRHGSRKRITIVPPSMGADALTSGSSHEMGGKKGSGEASGGFGGIGSLKYGRRSLRSELMEKILSGVDSQMEKLTDEEILIKAGEKKREIGSGAQ